MYHVIVSCEHARNHIPKKYKELFFGEDLVLSSHRGYDSGALILARALSSQLNAPLFVSKVSRLVVDCNRSLHHPCLFSEYTKNLSKSKKEEIIRTYYKPYRDRVEGVIQKAISVGLVVLHLSIHTFTPIFGIQKRDFDIGVLYDPHREQEVVFSKLFLHALRGYPLRNEEIINQMVLVLQQITGKETFRSLANKPYKGVSDGFTTYLRRKNPETSYIGIELEANQLSF